jgi:hypothetical protein
LADRDDGNTLRVHVVEEVAMRLGSLVLLIWLLIGLFAAYQRDDFNGKIDNCNKAATIAVTVVAGPLNYVGVNPKINCKAVDVQVPQPSK